MFATHYQWCRQRSSWKLFGDWSFKFFSRLVWWLVGMMHFKISILKHTFQRYWRPSKSNNRLEASSQALSSMLEKFFSKLLSNFNHPPQTMKLICDHYSLWALSRCSLLADRKWQKSKNIRRALVNYQLDDAKHTDQSTENCFPVDSSRKTFSCHEIDIHCFQFKSFASSNRSPMIGGQSSGGVSILLFSGRIPLWVFSFKTSSWRCFWQLKIAVGIDKIQTSRSWYS